MENNNDSNIHTIQQTMEQSLVVKRKYKFRKLFKNVTLSNKAITEIENFFDWIVILRVETEVPAKKKVT